MRAASIVSSLPNSLWKMRVRYLYYGIYTTVLIVHIMAKAYSASFADSPAALFLFLEAYSTTIRRLIERPLSG